MAVTDGYICQNQSPLSKIYIFKCFIFGNDLLWYLNDEKVASFLPPDVVGHVATKTVKQRFTITAVLTHTESVNEDYDSPVRISVLTVHQHLNENQTAIPSSLKVSCQTHCQDESRRLTCKTKQYNVAGPGMLKSIL